MPEGAGSDRTVFSGRLISVEVREGRYREVVHHPGACAAVVTAGGRVLLVRQFREAVGEWSLEVPAGTRDVEGEDAAACAAREVLEETGHRVTSIRALGRIYTSPGFLDERIDLFEAEAEPEPAGSPEEGMEVVRMTLAEAIDAVRDGGIVDAKSAVALMLVWTSAGSGRGPAR